MRLFFLLAVSALLTFAGLTPISRSAPLDGVLAKKIEVPADGWTETKRFRGGERASVHVVGDHQSSTTVHITIFDEKGKLVAEDKGKESSAGDMAAVIWYPPRDGAYRIVVRNLEARAYRYFIAIR